MPTPMSAATSPRTARSTASTLCVMRTAPVTRPLREIGTAVKRRSVSSSSLWRSPWVDRPLSASRISGREP